MYVIDVLRSVKTDHPLVLDFWRRDASNVNDFWNMSTKMSCNGNGHSRQPEFTVNIDANELVDADRRSQYFTVFVGGEELIVDVIS